MIYNEISNSDLEMFQITLSNFKKIAESGINEKNEKEIIRTLDYFIPFISNLTANSVFSKLHRVTINKRVVGKNQRIFKISELKYPPSSLVTKYGRCNIKGQSIFYSGSNWLNTMNEMNPENGDMITESVWEVIDEQPLKFSPIFKNQPNIIKDGIPITNLLSREYDELYQKTFGAYPPNLTKKIDMLIQFITDEFTREVTDNHFDYLFSAYFSNKIFTELEAGTIEAIHYPSVKEKLSFNNLAIKADAFDKKYKLIQVSDSVVVKDKNQIGGYITHGLGECELFEFETNQVLWDLSSRKITQPFEVLNNLKDKYKIELNNINNSSN